jgi:capsular exopolysaccharide synthesis family protein
LELRRIYNLLMHWLWLVVLMSLLAGGASYIISIRSTPVYRASTTLLVDQSRQASSDYTALMASERLSRTYAEWLRKRPVLEVVIQRLSLPGSVDSLARMITVRAVRDTQLILLTVEDSHPVRAAAIANMLPEVFLEQNQGMQSQRFAQTITSLEAQLEAVNSSIATVEARIVGASAVEQERLKEQLREFQSRAGALERSLVDIRLEAARSTNTVFAIERADPPTRPVRPNVLYNTILAMVMGALLAGAAVVVLEYMDDVVKTPDDVQAALALTTLAAVPAVDANGDDELLMLRPGPGGAAEAYRVLRTNLQFASVDRALRVMLVTSPSASEGKSTTASNLAIAMAQMGLQVLLMDADLHRPRQHKIFKLANNTGLTAALLPGEAAFEAQAQATCVPGLSLMSAGPSPANPSELLGSARMRELLNRLKDRWDIVIVDSPPVTLLSDSAVLAAQTDGVLLVLESGQTRRATARAASEALGQVHARVLGVVLNRVTRQKSSYYYGYEGYGAEGEPGEKSRNGRSGGTPARTLWQRLVQGLNLH